MPEVIRRRELYGITSKNKKKLEDCVVDPFEEADLLRYMIDYCDPVSGELLTPESVANQMCIMIFASMVTTAGLLNHCLCDLAGHGDMLLPLTSEEETLNMKQLTLWDALYTEQLTAIQADKGQHNFTTIDNLPLLASFTRESIRMGSAAMQ